MRLKIDNIPPMGAVRTTRRAKGKTDAGKRYASYKAAIRLHAFKLMGRKKPTNAALAIHITFHMPIPKSRQRNTSPGDPHMVKPDIDNLIKGVFDACNKVIWADDNQVIEVHSKKVYASDPGIDMNIKEIGGI